MRRSPLRLVPLLLGIQIAVSTVVTLGAPASASTTARYVGSGTAVARNGSQPAADEGSVVCDNGDGVGSGGFCLPFGAGNAISVLDDSLGENVPFQVCVDNDGDNRCTTPPNDPACPDDVLFSHDDNGAFYNPLGPLPTGFRSGCTGGPWNGYIVFMCSGLHVAGHDAGHSHTATTGVGELTTGGEGNGTFCGGTTAQPSRKTYFVGSGRYVAGGTAVVREDGQPVADEGSVVCDNGEGVGAGGFCIPFGAGNAVAVRDELSGEDVPFQVCVDNNGDGFCTSPDFDPFCGDEIFFSHDDDGAFYNPVGPVPTGFKPGCPGGAWRGYVVFMCNGAHVVNGSGHSHPVTTGAGKVTTGGEGLGTFCGGIPVKQSRKPYTLGVGADPRFEGGQCGLVAASDPTGEGDVQTGTLQGGPVSATEAGGNSTSQVTLTCTVQVGASGATPAGPDAAAVSASGTGVATIPPTQVSFVAPEDVDVFVCTTVTVDGSTYFYDAATGTYSPSSSSSCELAISSEASSQPADDLSQAFRQLAVEAGCPLLAQFFPPNGDIPGIVDCPPFGEGGIVTGDQTEPVELTVTGVLP